MICLLAGFAHMAFVSCDNGRNADDRLPDINDEPHAPTGLSPQVTGGEQI